MKHIAILSPCILPVPATKGGAVESLLTFLMEENERVEGVKFDLFSLSDGEECDLTYSNSSVYKVKESSLVRTADRIADKIYRSLPGEVSAKRFFDGAIISAVKRVITKADYKYDAVVVENMMSLAVKLADSGIVDNSTLFFHMHNDVDIYRSPYFCRRLADRKVTFLCVSTYIKNRVLKYAPEAVVKVLYNGTDTEVFDAGIAERKAEVRSELGLRPDEVVFLYSGRIIPQKGVSELIDGFTDFKIRYPEARARLLVVGLSDNPTNYENIVTEKCNNVGDNIICHNKVNANRMAEIVACADVVTIPTMDEEPFGMVAIEAMAMGKPVIATRSGALTELLTCDNAVFVEKSGNLIKAFSKAFETLMDAQLRETMGSVSNNLFIKKEEWHKNSFYKNFLRLTGCDI